MNIKMKKAVALLAVIAFIFLTLIIAEAYLLFFYNQYRISLHKILNEKAFYYSLAGIERGKWRIRANRIGETNPEIIESWIRVSPGFDLSVPPQTANEYPELPIEFKIIIYIEGNTVRSYARCSISFAPGEMLRAKRRVDALIDTTNPDYPITDWDEIVPAKPPLGLVDL